MKDYYKINEISKIYGISADSLRYYEKIGVLIPRRDTNGYRLYDLDDIYKLNIIRDLRELNFSMPQIKKYLENQSVKNTLDLLNKEQELVQVKLKELQTIQKKIQNRIQVLSSASLIKTNTLTIKSMPVRPCLQLNTRITRDEEMDLAIKRLHQKHKNQIQDFGNQLYGASVSIEDLNRGVKDVFNSVFFILDHEDQEFNYSLPEGNYLSLYYKGDYGQSNERILAMIAYAKEKGYQIVDDPFEIYEIDNRDTVRREEFLTEIQARIEVV